MSIIDDTIASIEEVDAGLFDIAKERLDTLTKPRGSLGRLEEFASRVVAITGTTTPRIDKKTIFTFAGDHGVSKEGVSAFPKEVTPQMVYNFLSGGAAINVLGNLAGAKVVVVDVGVDHDFDAKDASSNGLVRRKVIKGTANIKKGPAMSEEETLRCIETGIELAEEYALTGSIYGTGEMGIANTTPSSAIIAALTGCDADLVTGSGTGIDEASRLHKAKVIKEAIEVNRPDPSRPLDVLAKLGGTEIAAICGLVLGAAERRVPIVIDGFISTAAALVATELEPKVKDYLFAAHNSVEKGHAMMLERMGLTPFVDLSLRLGEGTGAAIGMILVEAGVRIYNEMASFEDAGVSGAVT